MMSMGGGGGGEDMKAPWCLRRGTGRGRVAWLMASAASLLGACSDPLSVVRDGDAPIQTDRLSGFAMGERASLERRVSNRFVLDR